MCNPTSACMYKDLACNLADYIYSLHEARPESNTYDCWSSRALTHYECTFMSQSTGGTSKYMLRGARSVQVPDTELTAGDT